MTNDQINYDEVNVPSVAGICDCLLYSTVLMLDHVQTGLLACWRDQFSFFKAPEWCSIICLVMPESENATFDGQGAGWCVNEPGSAHRPTAQNGQVLILYLLPGGEIEFTWT